MLVIWISEFPDWTEEYAPQKPEEDPRNVAGLFYSSF